MAMRISLPTSMVPMFWGQVPHTPAAHYPIVARYDGNYGNRSRPL